MKSPQDNIAVILKGVTCLYARLTYGDYTHIFQASWGTLWDTPSEKDSKCTKEIFLFTTSIFLYTLVSFEML